MSKPNSIVEVNGSRYDAVTGSLLTPRKISLKAPGKVIDGFVKSKARVMPRQPQPKAQKLHRTPQRSSTLMRHIVKRPSSLKAEGVEPKADNHQHIHPVRAARAKTIEKHSKVNRFGLLPLAGHPAEAPAKVRLTARAAYRNETAVSAPRVPSMITSASHSKLEDMLDEALLKADAHKQMMNRHSQGRVGRLPKWLGLTLAAVAILAIAFWLVWQNLPIVAMHVAAARAHVSATLPAYTPSGYRVAGPIKYQDGAVTMNFKNDSQQFSIIQKASSWNSTTLEDNKLASDSVQTSMVNGTTVYVYGSDNDAAWVNHGVMYTLKNDSNLSSDQIFKIVQSL